jgi:hypothetical protein
MGFTTALNAFKTSMLAGFFDQAYTRMSTYEKIWKECAQALPPEKREQ